MTTIYFHGPLAEVQATPIEVVASTVKEALEFIRQHPAFSPENNPKRYVCRARGIDSLAKVYGPVPDDELHLECEAIVDRHDVMGANNGWVKIVAGIVLIIVGVVLSYFGGGAVGGPMINLGIALIFGGIAQLLNPPPKPEEPEEGNKSLKTYQNTVKSGTTIPLILGKHRHGGHILSFNVETLDGKNLNLPTFIEAIPPADDSWTTLYDARKLPESQHPGDGFQAR
jgi:predicted phage tail protein